MANFDLYEKTTLLNVGQFWPSFK